MTKLNYNNRKSVGVKLGTIVAKDLRKRVKSINTPTKGDSLKDASPIELHLEGKDLTDEGIRELSQGLKETLVSTEQGWSPNRLQILKLSNNGISVKGLVLLSKAIEAAALDLEELDLSRNAICVETDEERVACECFLESFRKCKSLRHLNLSGNIIGNNAAMEVMARVFTRQFNLNVKAWETDIESIHDYRTAEGAEVAAGISELHFEDAITPPKTTTAMETCGRRHDSAFGLPKIRHIDLTDIKMTDDGALFLSYILERHQWAQNVICRQSWGQAQTSHMVASISYDCNEALSATGSRLLSIATSATFDPFEDPTEVLDGTPPAVLDVPARAPRRRSSDQTRHARCVSTSSSHDSSNRTSRQASAPSVSELTTLRHKIQRGLIEEFGPHRVQLWSAALKLLAFARSSNVVSYTSSMNGSLSNGDAERNRGSESGQCSGSWPSTPMRNAASMYANSIRHRSSAGSDLSGTRRECLPSFINTSPELSDNVSEKEPARPTSGSMQNGKASLLQVTSSRNVWKRICTHVADKHGVMSEQHKENVLTYAQSRRTLHTELDNIAKIDSIQLLKVLEAMGCLSY